MAKLTKESIVENEGHYLNLPKPIFNKGENDIYLIFIFSLLFKYDERKMLFKYNEKKMLFK